MSPFNLRRLLSTKSNKHAKPEKAVWDKIEAAWGVVYLEKGFHWPPRDPYHPQYPPHLLLANPDSDVRSLAHSEITRKTLMSLMCERLAEDLRSMATTNPAAYETWITTAQNLAKDIPHAIRPEERAFVVAAGKAYYHKVAAEGGKQYLRRGVSRKFLYLITDGA
jgi:hypothetical protein